MTFFQNENDSGDEWLDALELGALAFSHIEPAGQILFNDNALIPLNSMCRVCKGAWTAKADVWDIYCVFIYISNFFSFFFLEQRVTQTARLDVFQLWSPPGTTRSTFPVRAAVSFCAVLLSFSGQNTLQRLQN